MKMLRTMALALAASTAAGCGSSAGLGGLSARSPPTRIHPPVEAGPGMMNIAAAAARVLGGSAPPLRVGRMNLPQDGATLLGRWTALAGFIAGSAMPVPTPRLNPCLCGVFDRHYVVDVPGGASALTLRLKTDVAQEQYRLRIFGPDAAVLADRAVFGAREYELPVPNPTPGTYRAQVSEFTTQGGNLEVSISVR